ncbi:unnamed protein product, partial [Ectocarpus fasciculatus]
MTPTLPLLSSPQEAINKKYAIIKTNKNIRTQRKQKQKKRLPIENKTNHGARETNVPVPLENHIHSTTTHYCIMTHIATAAAAGCCAEGNKSSTSGRGKHIHTYMHAYYMQDPPLSLSQLLVGRAVKKATRPGLA